MQVLAYVFLCLLVSSAGTFAAEKRPPPELYLLDLAGKRVNPLAPSTTAKAVLFVFVSNDCPIANRYAPELQRLHKKYTDKDVDFWLVHADPDETPSAVSTHMREYGYRCGVLRDPHHDLVKLAKARVTPEAALFLPSGELVYRGRIDDRYKDFGKVRREPVKGDLQEAIEAVLAGRPVPVKDTKAIGCYIPGVR